jgi:hypothetical protein
MFHHPGFALGRYIRDLLYKYENVRAIPGNTVPHVSLPSVRVFSCGAVIGQETTLYLIASGHTDYD